MAYWPGAVNGLENLNPWVLGGQTVATAVIVTIVSLSNLTTLLLLVLVQYWPPCLHERCTRLTACMPSQHRDFHAKILSLTLTRCTSRTEPKYCDTPCRLTNRRGHLLPGSQTIIVSGRSLLAIER